MKSFLKFIAAFILIVAVLFFAIRLVNGQISAKQAEVRPESLKAAEFMEGLDRTDYTKSQIDGISVEKVNEKGLVGYHFKPDETKHSGIILTLAGSDGGIDLVHSTLLAKNGYDVYGFYYFGQKGLAKELVEVDINLVPKMIDYVKEKEGESNSVTLIGSSKGAELALLAAAYYPEAIDHLVLFAPSAYSWQGLAQDYRIQKSSWCKDGKPLPYLTTSNRDNPGASRILFNFLFNRPLHLHELYASQLPDENDKTALIPMEKVKADALIFAGSEDELWPSSEMGLTIAVALKGRAEYESYADAGHIFWGPSVYQFESTAIRTGGEYDANLKAFKESNRHLLKKMAQWADA